MAFHDSGSSWTVELSRAGTIATGFDVNVSYKCQRSRDNLPSGWNLRGLSKPYVRLVRRWHIAAVYLAVALGAVREKGRLQAGTRANVSQQGCMIGAGRAGAGPGMAT